MFDFKKIIDFPKSDLKQYGKILVKTHLKQIDKGIDANGKPFTKYSKVYREQKSANAFKKQGQISKQTHPVNLKLTGKLFKHFILQHAEFIRGELTWIYGFVNTRIARDRGMADDARSKSMVHGKKTKRVIASSNKLGPDVEEAVGHIFASQVAKNLQKHLKKRTVVYRV